jgi:hypothetical protein
MSKYNDLTKYDESNPVSVPILLLTQVGLSKSELEKASNFTLSVGSKNEIDLEYLHTVYPEIASSISRYWIRSLDLWESYDKQLPNTSYKKSRRNIYYNKMIDSKTQRTDLRFEIKLLSAIPVAGTMIKELLSANPDISNLESKYSALNLQLRKNKDASSNISFTLPANKPWPVLLGGNPFPGEVEREFNLKVSWAPWRDRRNRRLVDLSIEAMEIWPK